MKPDMILTFAAAVLIGEALQWATWKKARPEEPWGGYWQVGLPHLISNAVVVIVVAVAWLSGMLTAGLEKMGVSALTEFVSETKPFGFMLGLFADLYGDRLAFALRGTVEKRLGFLLPKEDPTAPAPPAGTPPTPEAP